jgi:hypothetical protein
MGKATRILLAITFALSLCLVSMGVAQADYYDPPGWDNNPYFTHQSWQFDTNAIPSAPTTNNNPFGVAEYDAMGATWHAAWEGRTGVWQYDELSWTDFEVPNEPVLPIKEVWFQATYWTNTGGQISEDSEIFADPLGDVTFVRVSREEIAAGSGWYRDTWMGTIIPQPSLEDFFILFDDGLGGPATVYVDQVDIDTRCVPIPCTVLLLGSGLIGLCGYQTKRKSGASGA